MPLECPVILSIVRDTKHPSLFDDRLNVDGDCAMNQMETSFQVGIYF